MKLAPCQAAVLFLSAAAFGCSPAPNRTYVPLPGPSPEERAVSKIFEAHGDIERAGPGKPITKVEFSSSRGAKVKDDDLECLIALTDLEELNLAFAEVSGEGFAKLSGLKHLRKVRLLSAKVTDDGIAALASLPALSDLNLDGTAISDAGLEKVCSITGLETLNLSGTKVTDPGFAHLKKLTKLRDLEVGSESITDAGLEHLRTLTGLEELKLWGIGVTDAGLDKLRDLPHLRSLRLSDTSVTDKGVEKLVSFPALRELSLCGAPLYGLTFTDAAIEPITRMEKLESLTLKFTQFTNEGLALVTKSHPHLRSLRIGANGLITGRSLKSVANCQDLETLDLWIMPKVTAADLSHLRNLKKLRVLGLNVDRTPAITDEGLAHLAGLTSLEDLDLFSQHVTDDGLKHLTGLTALRQLDLRSTRVTDQGIQRLKKSLPQLNVKGG